MKRFRVAGFLAIFLVALLMAGNASANSAPPRWYGQKGGVLLPGTSSQIHVTHEALHFQVAEKDGLYDRANVSAIYQMENRGPAVTGFPVVFVIQGVIDPGATLGVMLDGKSVVAVPVDTATLTDAQKAEMASAWGAMTQVIDPVTGERYDTKNFFGQVSLRFYQFDLDLPAGKSSTLAVSYRQNAATDRNRQLHPIYHYQYLILPAKAWASFGPLDIIVSGPGPDKAFFKSTLPMTYQNGEYEASFPGLPPEDLAFALMSRKGIIGGRTDGSSYYFFAFLLLLLATALVGWGLGRLTAHIRSRGWAIGVAVLTAFFPGSAVAMLLSFLSIQLFPALSDQNYGIFFSGVLMGAIGTLVLILFAAVTAARRHRRLHSQ